ncbi:MAG TPA: hypothetical protein VGD65_12525 [Chryseosolibacter sp.]
MLRFLLALLVVAAVVWAVVSYGAVQGYFQRPSFFIQTLIFLTFSTALVFFYLYTAEKPGFFVQLYLLTMAVKLLAYLVFCFVMISNDKPSAVGNVVFFMATYFLFTALEIGFLYRKISGQKPS